MTNERRVLVHPDKETLAGAVAARTIVKLADVIEDLGSAHVVLTGGTTGGAVLEAIAGSSARDSVDWSKVHFWWGDERWVPAGHADRNDVLARSALLDALPVDQSQIHAFAASDGGLTIEQAAEAYAAELAEHATDGGRVPRFDITFLGVGPDGHVASLFPGLAGVHVTDRTVISVDDSPKPPAQRLSLTMPVLNSSQRVFLCLSGGDKAAALGLALAGASMEEVPAAAVQGIRRTVFFVDKDAAAEVPENLIAPVNYWTATDEQ